MHVGRTMQEQLPTSAWMHVDRAMQEQLPRIFSLSTHKLNKLDKLLGVVNHIVISYMFLGFIGRINASK